MRAQKGRFSNGKRVVSKQVASPTMGYIRRPVFQRPAKKQVA